MTRWPNFFLIGAPKCGTTSLHGYLARHPDVFMCEPKEPHFFSSFDVDEKWKGSFRVVRDETAYQRLFSAGQGYTVVGEASTSYLWDPEAPARIHAKAPEAHLVAVLRDPVERAYSHYLNDVREGMERQSFAEAVRDELSRGPVRQASSLYVNGGRYTQQLSRYVPLFGERLLVLFFDDLARDPAQVVNSVFDFLGLEAMRFGPDSFEVKNAFALPRNAFVRGASGSPLARATARALVPPRFRPAVRERLWRRGPKPALDETAVALLANEYRPEIAPLEQLLGRRVPWRGAW